MGCTTRSQTFQEEVDGANPTVCPETRLFEGLGEELSMKICQSLTFMLRMIEPFLTIFFLPTKKVFKGSFYESYGSSLLVDEWAV